MEPLIRDNGRVVTVSIVDKKNERFFIAHCNHNNLSDSYSRFMGAIRGFNFSDENPDAPPQIEFNGANDFEKYIECTRVSSILIQSSKDNPATLTVNEQGVIETVRLKLYSLI